MATYVSTIEGIAYREAPPLIYEPPTRSTGAASNPPGAVVSGTKPVVDTVELVAKIPQGKETRPAKKQGREDGGALPDEKTDPRASKAPETERRQVEELKETDQRVRAHEQAHMSAGGGLVRGGATYQFKTGPDGQRYAVGVEVQLDTNPVDGDPEATKRKAERIRRAALAPADPSPQDRRVAAQAEAMANKASQEEVRATMGTASKVEAKPAAPVPGPVASDRPAVAKTEVKGDAPESQEKPMDKPASKSVDVSSDPGALPGSGLPVDSTSKSNAGYSGQCLPAMVAYHKPSALAAEARLNFLI